MEQAKYLLSLMKFNNFAKIIMDNNQRFHLHFKLYSTNKLILT